MSGSADFGISEEDREKIQYLQQNGAPRGSATVDGLLYGGQKSGADDDDGEDDSYETRDRVLTAPEFERLLIGALRMDDDEQALETWSALLVLGRLGLRAGEFSHFSIEWYNQREQILSIPAHDPCTKGRGGEPCGHCRQSARQMVEHGDERKTGEITEKYWQPKTEAAVRDIPVAWSDRVEEAILFLGQIHGDWPYSYSTLQRRLQAALENAPMLEEGVTTLHGLRGTAASYHAGNGLQKEALKQMMGWRDDQTPNKYLMINGQMTKRALNRVYR